MSFAGHVLQNQSPRGILRKSFHENFSKFQEKTCNFTASVFLGIL